MYCLRDPRTDETFYVGCSTNLLQRFSTLTGSAASRPIKAWVADLRADGAMPEMVPLEYIENADPFERGAREAWWIRHFAAEGSPLLNQMWPHMPKYPGFPLADILL